MNVQKDDLHRSSLLLPSKRLDKLKRSSVASFNVRTRLSTTWIGQMMTTMASKMMTM